MIINDRNLQWVRDTIKKYRIDIHDPSLVASFQALNIASPRSHDERAMRSIIERLLPYSQCHLNNPFACAPAGLLLGRYLLGYQVLNNLEIRASEEDLLRHTGVFGSTGSGKTTFLLHLLLQAIRNGRKVFLLDPKNDTTHLAVHHPEFLVFSPRSKFNFLQKPAFLCLDEFLHVFTNVWAKCWYSGENQKQVLTEALTMAFREHDPPSLVDVKRVVDKMQSPKLTYQSRDAITGVSNRLQRFSTMFPVPATTHLSITYETIFQHPLYMNALMNDEHTTFIYTLLVYLLFLHNRKNNIRDKLDYLLVNDEGNRFWSKHQVNIEETPTLVELQGVIREFSLGLIHSSINEASLHPILKSNTYIHVAMNLTSGSEEWEASKDFNFTPEQREYLSKRLERGQAIVRFGDKWREPILIKFPNVKVNKAVSRAQLYEAEERINAFAPPEPVAMPLQLDQEPMDTPFTDKNPEKSQETLEPKKHKLNMKKAGQEPTVALSGTEHTLLEHIIRHLEPTSTAYKSLGLHPATGTAAKKKLMALGLVKEEALVVRPGRGGRAKILFPSDKAYQTLSLKPIRGTRGGDSSQHRYLCRSMADLIPEANLELLVGDKSIDVLFRYRAILHRALWDALGIIFNMENKPFQSTSLPKSLDQRPQPEPGIICNMESNLSLPTQASPQPQPADPNGGQTPEPGIIFNMEGNARKAGAPFQPAIEDALIGIEVECSDVTKTTPENVRKNFEVGVSLQIFAIMPDQLARAKALLKDVSNVYVIDALQLLQTLREVYASKAAS